MTGPGRTVWITGLSGAGKSTLAEGVVARLRDRGETVVLLDGDELRDVFDAVNGTHHGRDSRLALALKYSRLCRLIASQGLTVVIATISMFKEVHAWNRVNLPGYVEIYLKVPMAELRRRDPKGLYGRFDAGMITAVAGLDVPIDEPESPDWVAEFAPGYPVDATVDTVIEIMLSKQGSGS